MIQLLNNFHFLRPLWWLAVIPAAAVLYAMHKKKDRAAAYKQIIAPHLLAHLMVGEDRKNSLHPLMLLSAVWGVAIAALAGPSFQMEPSPFSEDSAALMIAVKVTDSMLATDVQPSRLDRAAQKIQDLLNLRPGAKTGLVAFSGSAHLVMPLTSDPDVITILAREMTPEIMPEAGENIVKALVLCDQWLEKSGSIGSILLITDDISPDQAERFKAFRRQSDTAVHIFAVAGAQGGQVPSASLEKAASQLKASLTVVTADETDVKRLASNIQVNFSAALAENEGSRWKDAGYFLTPLIALLVLFWFRQGWIVKWE
jgi:Ca-activated chloride channel homolog